MHPHMISIASILIQLGRVSLASVLPPTSLMSSIRKTSASVTSCVENCLSRRKMMHVPQSIREKDERSECLEEQQAEMVLQ